MVEGQEAADILTRLPMRADTAGQKVERSPVGEVMTGLDLATMCSKGGPRPEDAVPAAEARTEIGLFEEQKGFQPSPS
jgi:hypothetical protein